MFRTYSSRQILLLGIIVCVFSGKPLLTQSLTEDDKNFLLGRLPAGAEDVSRSAEELMNSSSDVLRAADRLKQKQSCAMDRELIGLGSALQKAASVLQRLKLSLLEQQDFRIGDLVKPDPAAKNAIAENWRRRKAYQDALNDIATAGQMLQGLDPLGSAGPPKEAARLLKNAGQSLIDLDEKSGIGIYFNNAGTMLQWLAYSSSRYDKVGCADDARLIGWMVYLAGENMSGTASVLWQSASATALGTGLQESARTSPLSFAGVDQALDLYAKSLLQQAESLSKTADGLRKMDAPPAFADVVENFRRAAPMLDKQAAMVRALRSHVDHVREVLAGANGIGDRSRLREIVQATGTELKDFGQLASLIEIGEALISAGDSLEKNQVENAQRILATAGERVVREERMLVEARH